MRVNLEGSASGENADVDGEIMGGKGGIKNKMASLSSSSEESSEEGKLM